MQPRPLFGGEADAPHQSAGSCGSCRDQKARLNLSVAVCPSFWLAQDGQKIFQYMGMLRLEPCHGVETQKVSKRQSQDQSEIF